MRAVEIVNAAKQRTLKITEHYAIRKRLFFVSYFFISIFLLLFFFFFFFFFL
jgi:hypothetical protein